MARITAAHIEWLKHRIADIAYWYKKEGKRTHAKDIERLEEITAFYTSNDEKDFPLIFIALKNEIDSFWKAFIDRRTETQAEKILADHPNDHSFGREMGILFKELQSLSDTKDNTLKGITAPIHFDAFKIIPDSYTSLKKQIAYLKLQGEYAEHLNKKIAELDLDIGLKIINPEQAFLDLYQDLKKAIKKPAGTFTSREYDTFRRTITGLLSKIEESTPPFTQYLLDELKQKDSPIKQKILNYYEDKKDTSKEKGALTHHIGRLFDSSKIDSYYPQRHNALYEKFSIVLKLLPSNPTLDPNSFPNEIKSAFNNLFDNILADVCTHLLNSNGQLKPQLYDALGFTSPTKHDFKQDEIKDITQQIIKSYFNDRLIGAFLKRLQSEGTVKEEHMPGKISLFSSLLKNKFEAYEEHVSNALKSPGTAAAREKYLRYYARILNESEHKPDKTLSSLIDTVLNIKKNLIKVAGTLTESSKIEGTLLDSIEQSANMPNSAERLQFIRKKLLDEIAPQKPRALSSTNRDALFDSIEHDSSPYINALKSSLEHPNYKPPAVSTPPPTTATPTHIELSPPREVTPAAATTAATGTATTAQAASASPPATRPAFFQSTAPTSSDTKISSASEQAILAIEKFFNTDPTHADNKDIPKEALSILASFVKNVKDKLIEISTLEKKFYDEGHYKTVYQPALEKEEIRINKTIKNIPTYIHEQLKLHDSLYSRKTGITDSDDAGFKEVHRKSVEFLLPLFNKEKDRVLSIGKKCVAFNEQADPLKSQLNKLKKPILDGIEKLITQISTYKTSNPNTPLGRIKDSLANLLKEALKKAENQFTHDGDSKALHDSIDHAFKFIRDKTVNAKINKSSSNLTQVAGKFSELGETLLSMQHSFDSMEKLFKEAATLQDKINDLRTSSVMRPDEEPQARPRSIRP